MKQTQSLDPRIIFSLARVTTPTHYTLILEKSSKVWVPSSEALFMFVQH